MYEKKNDIKFIWKTHAKASDWLGNGMSKNVEEKDERAGRRRTKDRIVEIK